MDAESYLVGLSWGGRPGRLESNDTVRTSQQLFIEGATISQQVGMVTAQRVKDVWKEQCHKLKSCIGVERKI